MPRKDKKVPTTLDTENILMRVEEAEFDESKENESRNIDQWIL